MILQCNECRFRYQVPYGAIGPGGRTVRCANCRHTWLQRPLSQEESLADMERMLGEINAKPKPTVKPLVRGANVPVVRKGAVAPGLRVATLAMAVAASLLALLITVPSVYGFTPSSSLVLSDVLLTQLDEMKDERPVYAISGKIVNRGSEPAAIPVMRIILVDGEGATLQPWEDSSAQGRILQPGEEIPFNFDDLAIRFGIGTKFVVDLGNPLELALRRKP